MVGVLAATLVACSSYSSPELTAQLPTPYAATQLDQPLATETLATLPNGDHLLVSPELIDDMPENYKRTHLRKTGNTVVGIHLQFPDDNPCFQGTIQANQVITVAIAQPLHQGEEWRMSQVERLDFTGYQQEAGAADARLIDFCASQFL